MNKMRILFVFAVICAVAYSSVISVDSDSNLVKITSSPVLGTEAGKTLPTSSVLITPDVFKFGVISVPKRLCTEGLNGLAYKQLSILYPKYNSCQISSCSYTVYGPSRIYNFSLLDEKNNLIKVLSSVQNNQEDSGQSTQEVVLQETTAKIQAEEANKKQNISHQNSGFQVIKLSRAYQIPRIALAIKNVIITNWRVIRSAPLVRCLEKWSKGVYNFRLSFYGVNQDFEYVYNSNYVSDASELENPSTLPPLKITVTPTTESVSQTVSNNNVKVEEQYLARVQPIFTVTASTDKYQVYTLEEFRKNPGYKKIIEQCNQHFGKFDERWISKIQIKSDPSSGVYYFQIVVNFIPFLCEVDLEAHYYGSTQKASILQIDEKVFSGKNSEQYFNSWSQIKDFNSYKVFELTNQYVLSQFTYLRFYKVVAAYTALYKNGRYIRLVYESTNNYFTFTPNGQNQFNILVYMVDGKFYMDLNDFHATNTYSFGRNDWVSPFQKYTDVNSTDYNRIVKYFNSLNNVFWTGRKVQEVRFKDNLYVIKFRNPTNITLQDLSCAVVEVNGTQVRLLNHYDWVLVDAKSPEHIKAADFVQKKYNSSIVLFSHNKNTTYGRHFEVSYLKNDKKTLTNAYLRWIDGEKLFIEDQWQGIAYSIQFDEVPLPKNPEQHLVNFVISQDKSIILVVDVKNVTKTTYQCVAESPAARWRINANWIQGNWVISSKQSIEDGYYFITGYPSVNVASCTGYLARLYPSHFTSSRWIYSSIGVKNIGYFIYTRIIFKINNQFYQGVVRSTHGVENSQTLISWDRVFYGVEKDDYGYGVTYTINYGYSPKYFFDYTGNGIVSSKLVVNVIEKGKQDNTDALCSYWSGDLCLSCYGDYYSEDGKCVKIQQECEYWSVSGQCQKCCVGFVVDSNGKCVSKTLNVSVNVTNKL